MKDGLKLSVKASAFAGSLLWGGAVLFVAAAHAFAPAYGDEFLRMLGSVYPGFPTGSGPLAVVGQTLYGMSDGAVAGALFAWLYGLAV